MQAQNLSYPGRYQTFESSNTLPGGMTTSFTVPAQAGYVFSFGGFGSNDPRRRKAPTAGTYVKDDWKKVVGTWTFRSGHPSGIPYVNITTGNLETLGVPSGFLNASESSAAVYNTAISRLYDAMRSAEANLSTTIGEAPETIRMLKSFARAAKIVRDIKRGKLTRQMKADLRKRFRSNPSIAVSESWLTVKYGLMPLQRDVYNWAQWTDNVFWNQTFRGRAKQTLSFPDVETSGPYKIARSGKWEIKCEVKVDVTLADPDMYEASRLGLLNPLGTAWELVPLSFVFDWFLDIGTYLESREAATGAGLQFNGGYVTIVIFQDVKSTITRNSSSTNAWGLPVVTEVYGTAQRRYVSKSRTVLATFPQPNFPRVSVRGSAQKLMSAVALLRTIVLSKRIK